MKDEAYGEIGDLLGQFAMDPEGNEDVYERKGGEVPAEKENALDSIAGYADYLKGKLHPDKDSESLLLRILEDLKSVSVDKKPESVEEKTEPPEDDSDFLEDSEPEENDSNFLNE